MEYYTERTIKRTHTMLIEMLAKSLAASQGCDWVAIGKWKREEYRRKVYVAVDDNEVDDIWT